MNISKQITIAAVTLATLLPLRAAAAPSITVTYPAENEIITEKKIVIKGSAADPSGLTDLIINGKGFSLNLSKNMEFERKVVLAPGGNSILVTAINNAGEITEREIFVQYTPPGVKPIDPAVAAEKPVTVKQTKMEPPAQPQPRPQTEEPLPQPQDKPQQTIPKEKLGRLSESELVSSLPANAHNVSSSKAPADGGEPILEPGLMPLPAPGESAAVKSPEPITEPSPALIKPYPGEAPDKRSEPIPEIVFPGKTEIRPIPPGKSSKAEPEVIVETKKPANATTTQPSSKPEKTAKTPVTKPEKQQATAQSGKAQTQERKSPEPGGPVVEKATDDKTPKTGAVKTESGKSGPEQKSGAELEKDAAAKQPQDDKKETKPSTAKADSPAGKKEASQEKKTVASDKTAAKEDKAKPATDNKEPSQKKGAAVATGGDGDKKKESQKPQAVASAEKQSSSARRPVGGTAAAGGDIPPAKKAPAGAAPADNGLYTGECRVLAAGSYLYRENADAAARDIAKNGVGSSMFEEKIGKTTIYHIVIGIYRTQSDADSAAANFKLPGYKPAVSKTWCENVRFPDQKVNSAPPVKRDSKSGDSEMILR